MSVRNGPSNAIRWRCLTMHAERLERDDVWQRTDALLHSLEAVGGRATLFVHPFSALAAGIDIGPRIREFRDRGHEIGQHTHFYGPRAPGARGKPRAELSDSNVLRCLERDLGYLREVGVRPRGFVAGGWVITPAGVDWVTDRGFEYDASVRSFRLKYSNRRAMPGDRWLAPALEDGVVRLPTTTPLTDAARLRERPMLLEGFGYDLAYVHDYDLTAGGRRLAARAALRWWRRGPWATAGELAERVRDEIAPADT